MPPYDRQRALTQNHGAMRSYQNDQLDPDVCSPTSLYRYWNVSNLTGTTEVGTEHFGRDPRAPPAEVTTFEPCCTFNSMMCPFVNGGWACFSVVVRHQTQSGSDRPVVRITTLLRTAAPGQHNEAFRHRQKYTASFFSRKIFQDERENFPSVLLTKQCTIYISVSQQKKKHWFFLRQDSACVSLFNVLFWVTTGPWLSILSKPVTVINQLSNCWWQRFNGAKVINYIKN